MQIRGLKTLDDVGRHGDGNNFYLLVSQAGSKTWQVCFRFCGKENVLTLGKYPDLSLKGSRMGSMKARFMIQDGLNPDHLKRECKQQRNKDVDQDFTRIAEQWFKKVSHELKASTLRKNRSRLNKYLLPDLSRYLISHLTRQAILNIGQIIQTTGAHEKG